MSSHLVPLCCPRTFPDLAVITSLLSAEGIYFFVHNEYFGALQVGPWIPLVNVRTVFVPACHIEAARDLLTPVEVDNPRPTEFSPWDKIRTLLEVFVLGWVIPTRRFRRGDR